MRLPRIRSYGSHDDVRSMGVARAAAGDSRGRRVAAIGAAVAVSVGFAASTAQAEQRYAPVHPAAAGSALGVAASSASPLTYVGTTNQFPCTMGTDNQFCGQVNVFMAKGLVRVKRLLVGFEAPCKSPGRFYGSTWMFTKLPTKRSKHNKVASFKNQSSQDQELGGGLTAHDVTSFAAKVTTRGRGSGTFQTNISIVDATGQTVDTCATGPLTYQLQALT